VSSGLIADHSLRQPDVVDATPSTISVSNLANCELTIVIPTRNEAGNVSSLVGRLQNALHGTRAEVLFVDDSTDDTPDVIRGVAASVPLPVRVLHRRADERRGGLGGAVVAGMRAAHGEWVLVMDGDLQHPPEVVPSLYARGLLGGADVVIASRYSGSGDASGLATGWRMAVSSGATAATKSCFPRGLRGVTDPMTGFFAVRRAAIDLDSLQPNGFKILLELLVRCRGLRIAEVPFEFATRQTGESKATLAEGIRFACHLTRLRAATLRSTIARAGSFAAVGASGIAVNLGLLAVLVAHPLKVHYLLAAALATQGSTTWNFLGNELFVFRGDKRGHWFGRYAAFSTVNNAALLLRLPLLALLVSVAHLAVVLGNALTLVVLFAARFAISDRLIYRSGREL
jgi:dolichol-phosphate mannosyltransferase